MCVRQCKIPVDFLVVQVLGAQLVEVEAGEVGFPATLAQVLPEYLATLGVGQRAVYVIGYEIQLLEGETAGALADAAQSCVTSSGHF